MQQYLDLLNKILTTGNTRGDRTGTGTRSLFGPQMRFNLADGFPLVTTKKVFTRGIIEELLWFLTGSTNNEELAALNVHIWDGWALPENVTTRRTLNLWERAGLFAEQQKISFEQAKRRLETASCEYSTEHGEIPRSTTGGELLLDDNGIPRDKEVIQIRKGALGPIYGKQWRTWQGKNCEVIDQIGDAIRTLKKNPFSRRIVVTAWNPSDLPDESISPQDNVRNGKQALASCHCLFQFYVEDMSLLDRMIYRGTHNDEQDAVDLREHLAQMGPEDTLRSYMQAYIDGLDKLQEIELSAALDLAQVPTLKLSCQLYQRSADTFLGVPFNIASYALLTAMIAQVCRMGVGEFVWTGGDTHLYSNHLDLAREQITRAPKPLPTLWLNPEITNIDDFTINDIKIIDYVSHPAIKGAVSI